MQRWTFEDTLFKGKPGQDFQSLKFPYCGFCLYMFFKSFSIIFAKKSHIWMEEFSPKNKVLFNPGVRISVVITYTPSCLLENFLILTLVHIGFLRYPLHVSHF